MNVEETIDLVASSVGVVHDVIFVYFLVQLFLFWRKRIFQKKKKAELLNRLI